MFDDLKQKNNQGAEPKLGNNNLGQNQPPKAETAVPASEPKKPIEDIFSKTEKGEKGETVGLQEPAPVPPAPPRVEIREEGGERRKEKVKKIFIFAIMIIGLVLVVFGIFWLLKKIDSSLNKETGSKEKQEESLKGGEIPNVSEENETPAPSPVPIVEELLSPDESMFFPPNVTEPADSDQDGLPDEEERGLGTNINDIDTDGDGLFDREEVKVYKTNPLVPDTDGDGYLDGDEVKDGYNPNGPGKLYEIN